MTEIKDKELKDFLDLKILQYNHVDFIEEDPVYVPHQFTKKEDIEIAGFLAATIAWGKRSMILKNALWLVKLMDYAPHDFIISFGKADLRRFEKYVHRTFNAIDVVYFLKALQNIYLNKGGLEKLFFDPNAAKPTDMAYSIHNFRAEFLSMNPEKRTLKHIADPLSGSAAKRINMFLRWMVRKDETGVDFGLWTKIQPESLILPLDIHSGRVARKLGLINRKANDWKSACELTERLKIFRPHDPAVYDFALFGLGIYENFAND